MRSDAEVVLITGAAGSFGTAMTATFAAGGARLVLTDLDAERLGAAVERARAAGAKHVLSVPADLTESAAVTRLFESVDERFDRLDVLINNAGLAERCPLKFHTDAAWRRVLSVNLDSVFHCSRAAVRRMLPKRSGCIINISSMLGVTGGADEIAYATAKAGVIGFTKSLAQEVGRRNIRVNAICASLADTSISQGYFRGLGTDASAVADVLAARAAMPRALQPADVADVAAYLASAASSYVNGQSLLLNGAAG